EEFREEEPTSLRDGFFLRATLSGEYSRLSLAMDGPDSSLTGLGVGFAAYIGGAMAPGSVFGVVIGGQSTPNPTATSGDTEAATDGRMSLVRVGLFGDLCPWETNNSPLGLEAAYLSRFFSGATVATEDAVGFGLRPSLGYDFW